MSISALSIAALGAPMAAAADADPAAPVTLRVGFTGTCADNAPRADGALYCTLAGATAAAQPGDSVLVGKLGATDKITGSGTPGKPITVFSHYTDQTFTDNSWQTVVSVTGQHDVVVRDIRLGGLDASGSSALSVDHVLVTPHYFAPGDTHSAPFAIRLSATTDSTVTDSHVDADNTESTNLTVGVLIENGSDRTTVSGTVIGDVYGTGVQVTDSKDVRLVSDTAADNISDIVLSGGSTGAVVENDIFADGGQQPALTVADTAIAGTLVGHNLFGSTYRPTSVLWGTTNYATGQAFDSAHLGSADLDGAAQLDTSNDPDWPATPQEYFIAPSYRLSWNSPAIDSADAAAPGEPAVDRVDDPDVADTGAGAVGYADRGAREFTGMQVRPFTAEAHLGAGPHHYLDVGMTADGMFQWSAPVSVTYNYGDGSAVTSQNSHTYPAPGTYHGTVTFTGQHGETATAKFTVSAPAPTIVTPTLTVLQQNDPHRVSISASIPGGASSYAFDFGDGQSAKNDYSGYVEHYYAQSGTYKVTATVTDLSGWTGTASQQVTITIPGTPTPPPPAGPGGTVTRIGGRDRYETSIDASRRQFAPGAAKAVVLARGDAFADALAGGPLAARVGGPLLLTDPKDLGMPTAEEIDRVLGHDHSRTVYLLGGEAAISPAVEKQVRALGYRIVRYGGASRFDTALKIAQEGMGATATVVVARGDDFADALAAGPLAANRGAVLVLSDKDRLDPATAAFVRAHQTVIAVGGPAWDAVAKQIPAGGKEIETAVGNDRYATAANTVRLFHLSAVTMFGVATGTTFPDALSGGALMAAAGQPLLLTDPATLPADTARELTVDGKRKANVTVFGGEAAISKVVEEQIDALVEWPH